MTKINIIKRIKQTKKVKQPNELNKYLINDICNIVGEYTARKTYEKEDGGCVDDFYLMVKHIKVGDIVMIDNKTFSWINSTYCIITRETKTRFYYNLLDNYIEKELINDNGMYQTVRITYMFNRNEYNGKEYWFKKKIKKRKWEGASVANRMRWETHDRYLKIPDEINTFFDCKEVDM